VKFIAKVLSTFLGAGFFPVAPGTFASLIMALLYLWVFGRMNLVAYLGMVVAIFAIGVVAATSYARQLGQKDPRPVVIDEVCGQLIALILVPPTWLNIALGFFLFRVFDIVKPFPIRKLERLSWGWGIVADDVLAGAYAAVLLRAYLILR
jgi:phosphatidylglycerophosphatase A